MIVKLRMKENSNTAFAVNELAQELGANVVPGTLTRSGNIITTNFQFPSEQDADFFAEHVRKMADVMSANTMYEEALEF